MKKNYIMKLKATAVVLVFMAFNQNYFAQTATVNIDVSEDTYVVGTSSGSGTNYGGDVEGRARDTVTSAPRITYYKFPVSNSIPSSVTSAVLKFYVYLPSSGGATEIMQIHKLTNSWKENVVTYDDKPDTGSFISEFGITSVQVASPNDYTAYTVDVTAYFNQVLAAKGTDISFAIKAKNKDDNSGTLGSGQSGNVRTGTKESETSAASSIEITYSTLGVDDFSKNKSSFNIYPNPVKSSFTLNRTFTESDVVEITIFNLLGAKVSSIKETVQPGVWKKEFSKKDLNMKEGIYLLKVNSKISGTSVSKIVVK